jgi:hypothetical protein
MCSYETIFNSFGKLIDSYGVKNPIHLVRGFPSVYLWRHMIETLGFKINLVFFEMTF